MSASATLEALPLVLAAAEPLRTLAMEVARSLERDAEHARLAVHVAETPAEALRLIHRVQPGVVCVCVAREHVAAAARLLHAVHDRRPGLPVVAVSRSQDADVEQVVRAAGAAVYFPLVSGRDAVLLRDAVDLLASVSPRDRPPVHNGPSPPRIRAGPLLQVSLRSPVLEKVSRVRRNPKP